MKKRSGEPQELRKVVTKVDDSASAVELMERMKAQLPIPAYPTPELARLLRDHKVETSATDALSIKRVFYAGDVGGISCDVTPAAHRKEAIVVSLTHLRLDPGHPLFRDIVAYQRERVKRIALQR